MENSELDDTIVAIATPPGYGAIAVIRLDGKRAFNTLRKIAPDIKNIIPRQAQLLSLVDRETLLDQALVTCFKGPQSYTGNDLVEISCHGSPYVVDRLIDLCLTFGARLAHPGEFTKRAFLNGKMNLIQAEAVAEIVFANHQAAHQSSIDLLTGVTGKAFQQIREQLINLISILELELDFSDQEIEPQKPQETKQAVKSILNEINTLLSTYSYGKIVREGAHVPIVGPPNSGKSSLLNALIMEDRAIVTPFPGTTRDLIEGSYRKEGYLFRLFDTAGLRTTNNPVEKIGIERAFQMVQKADLVLYVLDLTEPIKDGVIESFAYNRPTLIVLNKADIAKSENIAAYLQLAGNLPKVVISAKRHQGLDELSKLMVQQIKVRAPANQHQVLTLKRHCDALRRAAKNLQAANRQLTLNQPAEIVVTELRWALEQIDQIMGKTYNDEILHNIFNHFCIGK